MTSTTDEYREFYGKRAIESKKKLRFFSNNKQFFGYKRPRKRKTINAVY